MNRVLLAYSAKSSGESPSNGDNNGVLVDLSGFPELSQDDQLILIKIGFFEVWLGHVSRLINTQEGTMTLADGASLSKQQLDLIFDVQRKRASTPLLIARVLIKTGFLSTGGLRTSDHELRRRPQPNVDERQ